MTPNVRSNPTIEPRPRGSTVEFRPLGLDEEKRKRVCDKTPANAFAYAARYSGDKTLLDFAAEYLVRDADFTACYRTGVCSAKNWSETMGTHRLIQVFLHDVDKAKHPEKYKDLP